MDAKSPTTPITGKRWRESAGAEIAAQDFSKLEPAGKVNSSSPTPADGFHSTGFPCLSELPRSATEEIPYVEGESSTRKPMHTHVESTIEFGVQEGTKQVQFAAATSAAPVAGELITT